MYQKNPEPPGSKFHVTPGVSHTVSYCYSSVVNAMYDTSNGVSECDLVQRWRAVCEGQNRLFSSDYDAVRWVQFGVRGVSVESHVLVLYTRTTRSSLIIKKILSPRA